jgi:hypothetical protein
MPRKLQLEEITEEFCSWPYFVPYVFLRKVPRKPRVKKVAVSARRRRKPRTVKELMGL